MSMTDEEWNELVALKDEIDGSPQSVSTDQQERFTELMVKSLMGKGDRPLVAHGDTYKSNRQIK